MLKLSDELATIHAVKLTQDTMTEFDWKNHLKWSLK